MPVKQWEISITTNASHVAHAVRPFMFLQTFFRRMENSNLLLAALKFDLNFWEFGVFF